MRRRWKSCCESLSDGWPGEPFSTIMRKIISLAGVVSFASLSDHSTRVTLKLTSSFGGVPNRVDKYLRNFKRLIEKR